MAKALPGSSGPPSQPEFGVETARGWLSTGKVVSSGRHCQLSGSVWRFWLGSQVLTLGLFKGDQKGGGSGGFWASSGYGSLPFR